MPSLLEEGAGAGGHQRLPCTGWVAGVRISHQCSPQASGTPPWLWELLDHTAGSKLCHECCSGGWPWGNCSQAQIGHRLTTHTPHSRLWLTAAANFSGIQKPPRHHSFSVGGPPPLSTSARRMAERGETPCAGVAKSSRWILPSQQ